MRYFLFTILLTGVLVLIPIKATADPCNNLTELKWLLGDWQSDDGDKLILERWKQVSEKTFEGIGEVRSKTDNKLLSSESLRLVEMSNLVFFVAKVEHNERPVSFKQVSCSDQEAVFENQDHDFPKRIIYKQRGMKNMMVDVRGDRGKGFEISFRRVDGS